MNESMNGSEWFSGTFRVEELLELGEFNFNEAHWMNLIQKAEATGECQSAKTWTLFD